VSDARTEILKRIRGALGEDAGTDRIARDYRTIGAAEPGSPATVDLLRHRLRDYRATVVTVSGDEAALGRAVAAQLNEASIAKVAVPAQLPRAWTAFVPDVVIDDGGLDWHELDHVPAVVTGCVAAIAQTGTLVLDGSAPCGRRALTLLPDVHLVVVRERDIVCSLPEGLRLLDPQRPTTFISGPSATSDIELKRVEGVHGPRNLLVVIWGEGAHPKMSLTAKAIDTIQAKRG